MRLVKQNAAYNLTVFMTDAVDHVSAKTGLTLTITASKDGAAFGAITPTVTELANGWYKLALTASHTDTVGDLALHVTGSGADPTDLVLQVRANVLGDTLPASLADKTGFALTSAYDAAKTAAQPSDIPSAATIGAQITTDHGSGSYARNTEPATAAAIASEVRTELATELAHLDADVSSRSTYDGSDPTGVTTLLARLSDARANLLDALSNVDATISSRLAASSYTAPNNVGIAAIYAAIDTEVATILTALAAIQAQTDLLPSAPAATGDAMTLTSGEREAIADAHLDRADAIEAGLTVRGAHRLTAAAAAAKASGMDVNQPVFRNAVADSKNRISAQTDEFGNRLAVSVDVM